MDTIWQNQCKFTGPNGLIASVAFKQKLPRFHVNQLGVAMHVGNKLEINVMKTLKMVVTYRILGLVEHEIPPEKS